MQKGFTLIELLVVVLIIGILASIALPNYFIAVKTAKIKGQFPVLRSIMDAQKRYYLATGQRTADLDLLDVSIPYLKKDEPSETGRIGYTTKDGSFNLYLNTSDYIVFGVTGSAITIDYYGAGTKYNGVTCVGVCYAGRDEDRKICAKLGQPVTSNSTGLVYAIEN